MHPRDKMRVAMNEQACQIDFPRPTTGPGKTLKHKVRILVAVNPRALFDVIEYLFRGRPEFEIVEAFRGAKGVARHGERLRPELIVVNVKPLKSSVCRTIQLLKRSSPSSKLILIFPVKGFAHSARRCGADACLEAEALLSGLLPAAQRLAGARQTKQLTKEKNSS